VKFDAQAVDRLLGGAGAATARAAARVLVERVEDQLRRVHPVDDDGDPVDLDAYRRSLAISSDPLTGAARVGTSSPLAARLEYGDASTPPLAPLARAVALLAGGTADAELAARLPVDGEK
jgi:hypothetical protein